ncbi:MAG: hypothetical protein ACO3QC_03530 [Phycisphaerales bacterium]
MPFGLAPNLAVPAGTAIAGVANPLGDPDAVADELGRLEAIPDAELADAAASLVERGLFVDLPPSLVVVRASKDGLRRLAVLCGGSGATVESNADEELRGLLEAETRQRPLFHGTTRSGTTYSGFRALESDAILGQLNRGAAPLVGGPLAVVFAGEPWRLPRAIAVPR